MLLVIGCRLSVSPRPGERHGQPTTDNRQLRGTVYRPAKLAFRFWLYAPSPSFASSLWKSCCCSSRSSASADSNGISAPLCTERLMRPTAFAALFGGQKLVAYSITRSHHFCPFSSDGQT